jgi:hypothetical protein
MPRTYASIIIALTALGAAACHDGPVRPVDSAPQAERTIGRTVNGKTVRLRYDRRTATISVDGRPTLRVRYDGDRRHVTAFFANGRTFERTYTHRELAAAAHQVPRPSLDIYDDGSSGSGDDALKCSKEWVAFAGAALVAVVTCEATGPTPACAAAVAAAAVALDAVITCEKAARTPAI